MALYGFGILVGGLDDAGDALAHHHGAGDHPVHRTAINDFGGPAGKAAGEVAERRVGRAAAILQLAQMGDVAHPDCELHDVEHRQGVADARHGGKGQGMGYEGADNARLARNATPHCARGRSAALSALPRQRPQFVQSEAT